MGATEAVHAVGFPGQGGDWRAALRILQAHSNEPEAQALAERLGTDDWGALDQLDTRTSQPVVVATGLLAARLADLAGAAPVAVVGHSLGEVTACCLAGALTVEQAIDLASLRADLGHRADEDRPGAMVAIMRLRRDQVEWIRRVVLARHVGVLEVAVVNSPTQVVLSGDRALCAAASTAAEDAGGVARALPIGGAFHSPVMASAVEPFTAALRGALAPARIPVVPSAVPVPSTEPTVLAEAMARSLVLPVDWPGAIGALVDLGVTTAVDAGPGDTLVRLARFETRIPFEPCPPLPA